MLNYNMQKTLHWKKTIGTLAIVLGLLRLESCIDALSNFSELQTEIQTNSAQYTYNFVQHVQEYLSVCLNLVPAEMLLLGIIFTLGVVLLCVERNTTVNLPRPKSRKICLAILIITVIYLLMEGFLYLALPSELAENISPWQIIASLSFICVLIIYCSIGLRKQTDLPATDTVANDAFYPNQPTFTPQTNVTSLDQEIAELKRQLEKRQQEKLAQAMQTEKKENDD